MKQKIFSLFVGLLATVAIQAQQIAVVSGGGATSVYQTLADAIEGAAPGSTIYLPGGGFQISDDVKIEKMLSIIGIGHKAVSENADGNTVISGNLFFNEGSSNSAIMGCYISGNINVGNDGSSVNNILIKYCNLNAVEVQNNTCTGTMVSQNYIRGISHFNEASCLFTNNIAHSTYNLDGGTIVNNIFTGYYGSYSYYVYQWTDGYAMAFCDNCSIKNNVILDWANNPCNGSNNNTTGNMAKGRFCDDPINMGDIDWNNVFVNYNNRTISPASNFHFKCEYQQYEDEVGIYGGTEPFNDSALPPVPYIVSKVIPEQTDASGKLNIKIRVKAGE